MAGRRGKSLFLLSILFVLGACQDPDRTVDFAGGSEISISCNAATIQLDSSFTIITRVRLEHADGAPKEMSSVVQRNGFSAGNSNTNEEYAREGWTFTQPTPSEANTDLDQSNPNNRASLSIVATKAKSECSDAGLYTCFLSYLDGSRAEQEVSQTTNFTSRAPVVMRSLDLNPSMISNEYDDNMTVTITCSALGPEDYAITWASSGCPQFNNWPRRADDIIKDVVKQRENTLTGGQDDCNTYRHTQDIDFTTSLGLNGCELICYFGAVSNIPSVRQEVSLNVSITVLDKTVPPNPPTGGSTSSASGDSLAIGLGVGLSLLAVIVIVILIYVFCFRKRNKDKQYGEEGQDHPDTKNMDTNAPPPVFYSKPHKPPKSEKNDAWAANQGSDDSYPYEKDIRRKPYYDDYNNDEGYEDRKHDQYGEEPARRGRRRSDRRSRGSESIDESGAGRPRRYSRDRKQSRGDDDDGEGDNPRRSAYRYDDGQPYASTDISRSEDEYSDATGRPRPKPKRRTKYTPTPDKELHYADLDLPESRSGGRRGDDEGGQRDQRDPIHYASIRV